MMTYNRLKCGMFVIVQMGAKLIIQGKYIITQSQKSSCER